MAVLKNRNDFFDSEEGKEIRKQLQAMAMNDAFSTASSYSANTTLYPDNLIPFVDKHMNYLKGHPNLDASKYVDNVRLMVRIR